VRPDVAPAAGEHAGARGGASRSDAEEDGEQDVVGEAADAVSRAMAAAFFHMTRSTERDGLVGLPCRVGITPDVPIRSELTT